MQGKKTVVSSFWLLTGGTNYKEGLYGGRGAIHGGRAHGMPREGGGTTEYTGGRLSMANTTAKHANPKEKMSSKDKRSMPEPPTFSSSDTR